MGDFLIVCLLILVRLGYFILDTGNPAWLEPPLGLGIEKKIPKTCFQFISKLRVRGFQWLIDPLREGNKFIKFTNIYSRKKTFFCFYLSLSMYRSNTFISIKCRCIFLVYKIQFQNKSDSKNMLQFYFLNKTLYILNFLKSFQSQIQISNWIYHYNQINITWILHQIIMYSNKVKLVAS